jgi:DNA-binding MarR family transcriptional regulator
MEQPHDSDVTQSNGLPDELAELPASAECVYLHLKAAGDALTQPELVDRSTRPRRTVRRALPQLENAGLVTSRSYPQDPRCTRYELNTTNGEG